MSKPLSEQVEGLEESLAQAVDDYNFWHDKWEATDRELGKAKFRAETAEAELDRAYERYDQAEKDRNHWHDKWDATDRALGEATFQADKAEQDRDQWKQFYQEYITIEGVPRVITADELREGQWIAYVNGEGEWATVHADHDILRGSSKMILLADAPENVPATRSGTIISAGELQVGDIVDVWHFDDMHDPYYPRQTILTVDPLIAQDFNFAGLKHFTMFQFRLLERPEPSYPDNPWFATVYEDGAYWADTWRGTPVTPASIRRGDIYDIHTAHGSTITGILAGRNGVFNPAPGDQYRLVGRTHD